MAFVQRKKPSGFNLEKVFRPDIAAFEQDPPANADSGMEQHPAQTAEPTIRVGIMGAPYITFETDSVFRCATLRRDLPAGTYNVSAQADKILFDGQLYDQLEFAPAAPQNYADPQGYFALHNVVIGIGFHWERHETQRFKGALCLLPDKGNVLAINCLPAEAYLFSVIASEMNATASLELLKAHAVISRSWLMAPILHPESMGRTATGGQTGTNEIIRWYERDAHALFDVCADDHCQRYQGIVRARTPNVAKAIEATRGEVLTHEGRICDARFSKSCGGVSEQFESCWADEHHAYLEAVQDDSSGCTPPDLTKESQAEAWIRSQPDAFCNTADSHILDQVLNDYDAETAGLFRWKKTYTQAELSALVSQRSGIDFGTITDLIPLQRGTSGRIVRLKIVGTKRSLTVGKELEIRKWLSDSHLYSSAFVVDKDADGNFTLTGAGWGHGVGLCQIGAAVMGAKGYSYRQILRHYFRNADISRIYH